MTPEGKVKELIKKFLKRHNIPYWMIVPNAYGRSTGISDVLGILGDGRFLAIEAKANGKKDNLTKNQKDFLDTIESNGGVSAVVSCQEDLDELESLLYGK